MAKKLPDRWPTFPVRKLTDLAAQSLLRQWAETLIEYRNRLKLVTDDHASQLEGTQGTGAPSSTPARLNQFYTDTSTKNAYISVGTSSSADWKQIT